MNFYAAYIKWMTDIMTISCQMSETAFTNSINQGIGATARGKKHEQSASIHRLKITKEAAQRLKENDND